MARRKNHQPNPNTSVLNLLLTAVALLCLWNLWAPSSDETEQLQQQQQQQQQQRSPPQQQVYPGQMMMLASTSTTTDTNRPSSSSSLSNNRQEFQSTMSSHIQDGSILLVPLESIDNGKATFRAPIRRDTQDIPIMSRVSSPGTWQELPQKQEDEELLATTTNAMLSTGTAAFPMADHSMVIVPDDYPSTQQPETHRRRALQVKAAGSKNSVTRHRSKLLSSKLKKKSMPSSRKLSTQPNSYHYNTTTTTMNDVGVWVYLLVGSASIIMGALMAKKALDRIQKWEQLSEEDSLAYDMAYSTTLSPVDYQSVISTWDGDYLDRFDI